MSSDIEPLSTDAEPPRARAQLSSRAMNDHLPLDPAPAPWTLRGDAHVLLARAVRRPRARLATGISASAGGLGLLGFIRYAESNVGAYDELLWLAPWGLSVDGGRFHTVTRIYVSSQASLENGRREWGIPKQLARFEVEHDGDTQRVHVTSQAGPVARFAIATGRRSVAVDANVLPRPALELAQVLDGRLFRVTPRVRGQLHHARFSQLSGHAGFAELEGARGLAGLSLLDFTMVFPRAEVRALER
jgi:acetoacetate decarboxylase